jgi:hypothetical protein
MTHRFGFFLSTIMALVFTLPVTAAAQGCTQVSTQTGWAGSSSDIGQFIGQIWNTGGQGSCASLYGLSPGTYYADSDPFTVAINAVAGSSYKQYELQWPTGIQIVTSVPWTTTAGGNVIAVTAGPGEGTLGPSGAILSMCPYAATGSPAGCGPNNYSEFMPWNQVLSTQPLVYIGGTTTVSSTSATSLSVPFVPNGGNNCSGWYKGASSTNSGTKNCGNLLTAPLPSSLGGPKYGGGGYVVLTANPFPLTAASNAAGGSTVYTGSFSGGASNGLKGITVVIAGFDMSVNNGTFLCTASTTTTLTCNNGAGVSDSHSATASPLPDMYWCQIGTCQSIHIASCATSASSNCNNYMVTYTYTLNFNNELSDSGITSTGSYTYVIYQPNATALLNAGFTGKSPNINSFGTRIGPIRLDGEGILGFVGWYDQLLQEGTRNQTSGSYDMNLLTANRDTTIQGAGEACWAHDRGFTNNGLGTAHAYWDLGECDMNSGTSNSPYGSPTTTPSSIGMATWESDCFIYEGYALTEPNIGDGPNALLNTGSCIGKSGNWFTADVRYEGLRAEISPIHEEYTGKGVWLGPTLGNTTAGVVIDNPSTANSTSNTICSNVDSTNNACAIVYFDQSASWGNQVRGADAMGYNNVDQVYDLQNACGNLASTSTPCIYNSTSTTGNTQTIGRVLPGTYYQPDSQGSSGATVPTLLGTPTAPTPVLSGALTNQVATMGAVPISNRITTSISGTGSTHALQVGPLAASQTYDFFCSGQYNSPSSNAIDIAATVSTGTASGLSSAQAWISGGSTLSSATAGAGTSTAAISYPSGIGGVGAIDGPAPASTTADYPLEFSGTFKTNTTNNQEFIFLFGSLGSSSVTITSLFCNLNPTAN